MVASLRFVLCLAGLVPGAFLLPVLVVPTDVQLPGTQPNEVSPLPAVSNCDNCHGGYDLAVEPASLWRGSAMAHAGRDPVFWASLAVAEQDFAGAGDLCLRCHTTRGWLEGRSAATDGSAMTNADVDGVECAVCHSMTNPDAREHLGVQYAPYIANDEGSPATGYFGSGMLVLWPGNERLGPYAATTARHPFLQSRFHRSPDFCGSCHDVSNPVTGDLAHNHGAQVPLLPGTFSGVPGAPVEQKAAFNNFPYKYGVVERTYSEAKAGLLTTTRIGAYPTLPPELQAGALAGAYEAAMATGRGGDYEDGTPRSFTCQSCHMAPARGKGSNKTDSPLRADLPRHDLAGANHWLADAILDQDGRGALRLGGGLTQLQVDALRAGQERARSMLATAVALHVEADAVRVVNLTAHKVITGYPEGRRMWLQVHWLDEAGATLRVDGDYGTMTVQHQGQPLQVETLLDLAASNTRVYEAKYGMTREWAEQLLGLGKPASLPLAFDRTTGAVTLTLGQLATQAPGTAASSFHFALLNTIVADNRIPPYGFAYDTARERNVLPVPATLFGAPGPGGIYQHHDRMPLAPPPGAVAARVRLLHQAITWEYVQFLVLANDGSIPFLASQGRNLFDTWRNTGMAPPYPMAAGAWCGMRGSGEDVQLESEVDGGGERALCVKRAETGARLEVAIASAGGRFVGAPALFLVQVHPTGAAPAPLPVPGLWLARFDVQLFVGPVPPGRAALSLVVPPGVAGLSVRFQGLALSAQARNGMFALTDAHDFVLR